MKFLMVILIAFALLPTAGWAEDARQADPADPGSAVPPFKYDSTFHRYMPHQHDAEVSDWRGTGFDQQAPSKGAMGNMHMQRAPARAQGQPQNDSSGPSGHGMHPLHDMHNR